MSKIREKLQKYRILIWIIVVIATAVIWGMELDRDPRVFGILFLDTFMAWVLLDIIIGPDSISMADPHG